MNYSIVIPIYNEQAILHQGISRLVRDLRALGPKFDVVLAENGSTDETAAIADSLSKEFPEVRTVHLPVAKFGSAFRAGALAARFEVVILMNADWLDESFVSRSLPLLADYDIVVGSKTKMLELDHRPRLRKLGSKLLTATLKALFGYRGSDSHGLKAFRKRPLHKLLKRCISDEIIESEIMLRADRAKYRVTEIPVEIKEIRPARVGFARRCLMVGRELTILYLRAGIKNQEVGRARLHADDAGLNRQVNRAIGKLLSAGHLQSFSIIANGNAYGEAVKLAKQHHEIPVFLHFNLIEGKPVSDPGKIPSLVSGFGLFYSTPELVLRLLLGQVKPKHIERELAAQFEKLTNAGIAVAGIDSHQHTHAFSPISLAVEKLARRQQLRFMRSYKQMETVTFAGFAKKLALRLAAELTFIRYYGKFDIPVAWKDPSWENFLVTSWEKIRAKDLQEDVVVVCHPGSSYDRTFDPEAFSATIK